MSALCKYCGQPAETFFTSSSAGERVYAHPTCMIEEGRRVMESGEFDDLRVVINWLDRPTEITTGKQMIRGGGITARTSRKADRELLLSLADALQVSKANIRRDPCGDWNIFGRHGHVSRDGVGFYVYLQLETKRRWEKTKRLLSFLTVTQDGDDEGILKMGDPPTAEQAATLRKLLGLRKAAPATEEQLATLRRFSFVRDKTPLSERIIGVAEGAAIPATPPPPESGMGGET
jgi:hypothetical protein